MKLVYFVHQVHGTYYLGTITRPGDARAEFGDIVADVRTHEGMTEQEAMDLLRIRARALGIDHVVNLDD